MSSLQSWHQSRNDHAAEFFDIFCSAAVSDSGERVVAKASTTSADRRTSKATTSGERSTSKATTPSDGDSSTATESHWASASQPASKDSERKHMAEASVLIESFYRWASALAHISAGTVIAPICVFILVCPLLAQELHAELWIFYYSALLISFSLAFSESVARLGFGDRIPWQPYLVIELVILVLCIAAIFLPCVARNIFAFAVVMLALTTPCLFRLIRNRFRNPSRKPLLIFAIAMLFGAVPSAFAMTLMLFTLKSGVLDSWYSFTFALAVWTFIPFLIRPIGASLWEKASPAEKFLTPLVFKLYCDLAFSIYGMMLFMKTPLQTIVFSLSTVPLLAAHLLRGTHSMLSITSKAKCGGDGLSARTARGEIVIEAFMAMLARSVALILLICVLTASHLVGEPPSSPRPDLFQSRDAIATSDVVDLFLSFYDNGSDWPIILLGFGILWVVFIAFCYVSHFIWVGKRALIHPSALVSGASGEADEEEGPCAVGKAGESEPRPEHEGRPRANQQKGPLEARGGGAISPILISINIMRRLGGLIFIMLAFQFMIGLAALNIAKRSSRSCG